MYESGKIFYMFAACIAIMFIGEHIAKLDDKGRLVFPSPLKALAESERVGKLSFVLKKNLFRSCLEMYTQEEWDRQSQAV